MINISDVEENIAANRVQPITHSIEVAVDEWLNNAEYRKNINGDFTLVAIAISESKDGFAYFTQIFAK